MKSPSLQVGNHTFIWGSRTYVMGILNITPDSFSGDGILSPSPTRAERSAGGDEAGRGARGEGPGAAVQQAREFLSNGADILDIGGESTRPGSQPVNAEEELERVHNLQTERAREEQLLDEELREVLDDAGGDTTSSPTQGPKK